MILSSRFAARVCALGLALLMVALVGMPAGANTLSDAVPQHRIPVAEVMASDGTLKPNPSQVGVLDLAGWQVSLDPQRGPILAPQAPTAPTWSALGSGVEGVVFAIAVSGGNVYVGGNFVSVCATLACDSGNPIVNRIARWNGATWSTLSFGLDDDVNALLVVGSDVYVGGAFIQICGNAACDTGNIRANRLAKWNGTAWSPVSNGLGGTVNALAVSNSDIIVGGVFTELCGNADCDSGNTTANRLAKWNGTALAGLANGVSGEVYALAANGSDLYAAGAFQNACGNPACNSGNAAVNYIVKWNGAGWSAVHFGFGDPVRALALDGTDLYAGGYFSYLCEDSFCNTSTSANHVAKWSGSSWSTLGYGVSATVESILISGDTLYAGGDFVAVCGNATCDSGNTEVHYLAAWNNTTWSLIDNGVDYLVTRIAGAANGIVVGGYFGAVCGNTDCDSNNVTVNKIAQYGECVAAPVKPILTSPSNKSTTTKVKVKLSWEPAVCAVTYNVTLKAAPGGTVASKMGLTKTKYTAKNLVKGKNYKWFVQACNTDGCTKSKTFKFTIQ